MTRNGQRAARTRRTDKESPPEYTYYIRYLSLCPADMEILRYMDRAMSSSRQAAIASSRQARAVPRSGRQPIKTKQYEQLSRLPSAFAFCVSILGCSRFEERK